MLNQSIKIDSIPLSLQSGILKNIRSRVLQEIFVIKGAVSRNSAKLGNHKMPVNLRET